MGCAHEGQSCEVYASTAATSKSVMAMRNDIRYAILQESVLNKRPAILTICRNGIPVSRSSRDIKSGHFKQGA